MSADRTADRTADIFELIELVGSIECGEVPAVLYLVKLVKWNVTFRLFDFLRPFLHVPGID